MKKKRELKKTVSKAWYTSMKPLANLIAKREDKKYAKFKAKCKDITDEELMNKFAKYIVSYLIKFEYTEEEHFMVFNKGAYRYLTHDDFEERILYRLRNIHHSHKDRVLKKWHYHNKKAKLYYKDDSEEMLAYERKLNGLLKSELDKLGVYAEYENIREQYYPGKGDKYDFYGIWLDKIGYEKSLIIRVK